jgi:hypothetical protein
MRRHTQPLSPSVAPHPARSHSEAETPRRPPLALFAKTGGNGAPEETVIPQTQVCYSRKVTGYPVKHARQSKSHALHPLKCPALQTPRTRSASQGKPERAVRCFQPLRRIQSEKALCEPLLRCVSSSVGAEADGLRSWNEKFQNRAGANGV